MTGFVVPNSGLTGSKNTNIYNELHRQGSLALVQQSSRKKNSEFKLAELHRKLTSCHVLLLPEVLDKCIETDDMRNFLDFQ